MVGIAQLAERQIVALEVVGSSPTTHPKNMFMSGCGAIGSALALGARGCQFESGHPDHFFYRIISHYFFMKKTYLVLIHVNVYISMR